MTKQVKKIGLERALREIPLLADSSGSGGWQQWHQLAGLQYRPMQKRLVIPDSNDRVQAVIDGQGIALWDDLVQNELDSGELFLYRIWRLRLLGITCLLHPQLWNAARLLRRLSTGFGSKVKVWWAWKGSTL